MIVPQSPLFTSPSVAAAAPTKLDDSVAQKETRRQTSNVLKRSLQTQVPHARGIFQTIIFLIEVTDSVMLMMMVIQ